MSVDARACGDEIGVRWIGVAAVAVLAVMAVATVTREDPVQAPQPAQAPPVFAVEPEPEPHHDDGIRCSRKDTRSQAERECDAREFKEMNPMLRDGYAEIRAAETPEERAAAEYRLEWRQAEHAARWEHVCERLARLEAAKNSAEVE